MSTQSPAAQSSTVAAPPNALAADTNEFPADRRRPRMHGRVVFVTGGTRGIGAAISRSFAEQGAIVAAGYGRDAEQARGLLAQLEAGGAKAKRSPGKRRSAKDCRRTVVEVIELH